MTEQCAQQNIESSPNDLLSAGYDRFGLPLLFLTAAFIPIRLSFVYATVVPLIILWFGAKIARRERIESYLLVPLQIFAIVAFVSSLYGINPARSVPKFASLLFFSLLIPVTTDTIKRTQPEKLITVLGSSACITALYGLINANFGFVLPKLPIGAVTQSGQLGILIPLAIGCLLAFIRSHRGDFSPVYYQKWILLGLFNAALLTTVGLSRSLGLSAPLSISLLTISMASLLLCRFGARKLTTASSLTAIWISCLLPILLAALLVNLKRGPWLGVLIACSILALVYCKKLLLPLAATVIAILILAAPIRGRIAESSTDFFISGGRMEMWRIGGELALKYPLGIGYHNSAFLRNFSAEIPPQHRHFHNNFLNILVETGWIGLAVFVWWLARILRISFLSPAMPLAIAIGCGILSWQAAGLVEYNFGDSEVVQLVFLSIGILGSMAGAALGGSDQIISCSGLYCPKKNRGS